MLIDTHGHVNFNAFKGDGEDVLARAAENNIWVVMPGSQYSTSKRAVEIAERYDQGVYAAVGLHPIHLGEQRKVDVQEVQSEEHKENPWETFETRSEEFDYEKYKELCKSKKVVAVGEIGLDYYYFPKSKARREVIKQKQKETLRQQMDLADEFNLPVILHCRAAHEDLLEFLAERAHSTNSGQEQVRGVVHSYTGTVEQAEKFMSFGLYIGFNGLIFKNVPAIPNPEEVIAALPLDRIVLETDSPYLIPPLKSVVGSDPTTLGRNEPVFVKYVAEEVARIKKVSLEEVAKATTKNAKALFGI
jgi:TatD DNase family protein